MRRALKWGLLGVGLVAAGTALYIGPRIHRLSLIGSGYVAKQMCSCVFVAERDFDACRADMRPDMARVHAALLDNERGVRAWVPGIASRVARYSEGTGCTLY